ncbi:energy-coupling factor transport system ATP-binding protein [Streptomyces sp. WMMB 714]|uniref:ABC transporter ATP-binding protein n=1 Tax=Streptomyces sp. WMMB 714 TaxID=1286822 RepID=UPI0005F85F32|nr:ABC transporter ATP-binding protein [Streptomyces sp. WMMB 714]SCK17923.1 energy-coupling factor transport system ATP-binding protein [Streptomyces sp. WMMB 714]
MIRFEQVSVRYEDTAEPAVGPVDAVIPEGELCLLVGASGTGKSTLLGTVSGLVPHFTGGTLHGRVTVAGRDTRTHKPRELADVVGTVGQDPPAHFVTDTVEDELAYGMESLGLPPGTMRRRVEETLDLLGLNELRDRPIATLSGGQQQRVAIGSVLTPHPRVLVLDEPTSALDPAAAEEVLAVLQRLVHDLGTTVLMAEHRLERVVQYADRVLLLSGTDGPASNTASGTTGRATCGTAMLGAPAEMMALSPVHPPVVALGRLAGWSPLPMSVRDARRRAEPLRRDLARLPEPGRNPGKGPGPQHGRPSGPTRVPGASDGTPPGRPDSGLRSRLRAVLRPSPARTDTARASGAPHADAGAAPEPLARVSGLTLVRGTVTALHEVDLTLHPGETVALMGRNGAGKSTLLGTLVGLHSPTTGTVTVAGAERLAPARTQPRNLLRHVGLVPQEPRDLLYADTVAAECAAADADSDAPEGTCRALVAELLPGAGDDTHPRDLSEGQRLVLALAVVLTARPPLILLDEPTRGLDYAAKSRLVRILRALADGGHAVVLATHDVELAAELAHRVVILAQGEAVADGPTAEVVTSSPAFAPQVAKILAPQRWLTVPQVRAALDAAPAADGPDDEACSDGSGAAR